MSELKVGDKVRCIEGPEEHEVDHPGGAGWKLGRIFVIDRFTSPSVGPRVAWPYNGGGIYEDWLELDSPVQEEKQVLVEGLGTWGVKHG